LLQVHGAFSSSQLNFGVAPLSAPAWRKKRFTNDWDRAWNPGNSIQLSIGQQDVQVTPLQMARFYAMIANGGKLVTPYVVSQVETAAPNGQSPVVERRFDLDELSAAFRVIGEGHTRGKLVIAIP
jgi:cell division protein FtsI/penicillin-binding protein 2